MNKVYLHGDLKEFGPMFELDVATVREAFIALCSQIEGFDQKVRTGAFRIVRRKKADKTGIDEQTLDLTSDECRFDIYPAMVGGKSGLGKILLGVAIIGIAVVTAGAALPGIGLLGAGGALGAGIGFMGLTYGGIAMFGAMLAFGGLAMMFAPSPKAQGVTGAKDESSYILSGPVNSQMQGVAVQLAYGRYLVGSVVVSSGLTIAQLLGPTSMSKNTILGAIAGVIASKPPGTVDTTASYTAVGYPNYPYATAGAGGTGAGGSLTPDDIAL